MPAWSVELPETVELLQGGTATVPLRIAAGSGVQRIELRLAYDPAVLAVPELELVSGAGAGSLETDHSIPGELAITATLAEPLRGDGHLLDLTVLALAAAPSSTQLAITACTLDHGAIGCAPRDALVTIRRGIGGHIRVRPSGVPVNGATMTLRTEAAAAATSTDAFGRFGFSGATSGTVQLEPVKDGDIRGAITAFDAALVLQAAAGKGALDATQALACDVDGDGRVSALDAARILQLAIRPGARLPVAERCGSDWAFIPEPIVLPGQRLIDPQLANGTCRRGAIGLDDPASGAPDQDFAAVLFGDCSGNWGIPEQRARAATSGDVRVRIGAPRRRNDDQWMIAIYLLGPGQSLDMRLAYDAPIRPLGVEASGLARDGMVLYDATANVLRVALAIAAPLPADGGRVATLVVEAPGLRGARPSIRLIDATVDEVTITRDP